MTVTPQTFTAPNGTVFHHNAGYSGDVHVAPARRHGTADQRATGGCGRRRAPRAEAAPLVSGEIQTRGGRRLFAVSLVISALGVALVAWWVLRPPRSWWVLAVGSIAAIACVAVAARGRRDVG